MKAIILCAGKGERLRPLTESMPKPMIPINGKPILEYLILLCKKHKINDIALNTSYLPNSIKSYFGDGSKWGVKVRYSFESTLLGTAGALNNFRDFINETFFVVYGDNVTDLDLSEMLRYHKSKRALATLFLYKEEMIDKQTSIGLVVVDSSYKVTEIIENPSEPDKFRIGKIPLQRTFINSGVYIFEPEILKLISEGFSDFAKDVLPLVLKTGKVYGFTSKCYFKEVGQFSRYSKAKEDIESGKVKLNL